MCDGGHQYRDGNVKIETRNAMDVGKRTLPHRDIRCRRREQLRPLLRRLGPLLQLLPPVPHKLLEPGPLQALQLRGIGQRAPPTIGRQAKAKNLSHLQADGRVERLVVEAVAGIGIAAAVVGKFHADADGEVAVHHLVHEVAPHVGPAGEEGLHAVKVAVLARVQEDALGVHADGDGVLAGNGSVDFADGDGEGDRGGGEAHVRVDLAHLLFRHPGQLDVAEEETAKEDHV